MHERSDPPNPDLSPVAAGLWRLHRWNWPPAQLARWIEECVAIGITSFDHADIYGDYGNEALFGAALRLVSASTRDRIRLVSKCGIRLVTHARPLHRIKSYDSSGAHIRASVDHSLQQLGVDRLELLLLHRPDSLMEPIEVAAAFADLQRAGKVAHFGVSNFTTSQFELLHAVWPLATNQIEFGPLALAPLDDGTLDQCLRLGTRPMAWSPLSGGNLLESSDARAVAVRAALQPIAAEHALSLAGAAYAWLARHPCRPWLITGSGRLERVREAVAASAIRITREQWYAVLQASRGHEVA
ncbi:MAG: aldo/keto reductase [Gammaproteobacteria bacterium]|nr:aldo/keto reductase [Gammaproteobacteria bacterium]